MARYAERVDLYRWGVPAARIPSVSTPDQDAALDAASALADSFLAKGYSLPLASWGDALKRATAQIAAYDLVCNVGINPISEANDAVIMGRHKEALKWLERVADGRAELGGVDATADDDERDGHVVSEAGRRWRRY